MALAHSVTGEEIRRALGEVLRRAREDRRRTLTEVAREAGLSPAYLSEVERGLKDISTELLVAVTHALGLPPAEIYLELGGRLDPERTASRAGVQDPRRQLRIAAGSLPEESLRSLAQFSAFLANTSPKPRIGFATGEPRR
jgi:transcriptional regulator with XRE-family HTH domain